LNKKSFSIFELIIVIVILLLFTNRTQYNIDKSNLDDVVMKLKLYLNYTRYIAFLDNKYTKDNIDWKTSLWTLKFQRCSKNIGGIYFVVYSDTNTITSHFKKTDCLKDPLTNKYLYSNWDCKATKDESKYVLLTKQYDITKIKLSCNTTSTLGQISFGANGDIYSSLGDNIVKITKPCYLTLYNSKNQEQTITIEPTGYSY